MNHYFYETSDTNKPTSIIDSNGVVCLAECKVCGLAEGALTTDCPNTKVPPELVEDILKGKMDYIKGEWLNKPNPTITQRLKQKKLEGLDSLRNEDIGGCLREIKDNFEKNNISSDFKIVKYESITPEEYTNEIFKLFPIEDLVTQSLGLMGESGELADTVKKLRLSKTTDYYKDKVSLDDVKSELSDVLWHIAQISKLCDSNLQQALNLEVTYIEKKDLELCVLELCKNNSTIVSNLVFTFSDSSFILRSLAITMNIIVEIARHLDSNLEEIMLISLNKTIKRNS